LATIVASDNEYPKVIFVEGAAPGTPPSGFLYAYAKSDGKLYYKDDGGTEHGPLEAADLSAHTGDTTDAHDASAISAVSSGYGNSSGTDVQTILDDFDAAITAASGGGGSTIQYGSLKPSPPDEEFDGSSLANFAANSQGGSFALTDCFEQAIDGSHVQLGYHDKSGSILKTQANTNLDFRVGGFRMEGNLHPASQQKMPGIAVVDSSGNGVALVFNSDLHTYLAELTAYAWTGTTYGSWQNTTPEYATEHSGYVLRITRVTNTWTGYLSFDGVNYTAMSATGSKTITVNRVGIGTWKPNDGVARGRILADWLDVT